MIIIIISSVLIVVNIIAWVVFFVMLKKKYAPKVVLKNIRSEINELISEMNRETDRDISLLEARRDGLKKLIEEAQRVTALAQGELSKREIEKHVLQQLNEVTNKVEEQPPTKNKSTRATVSQKKSDLFELNLAQNYVEESQKLTKTNSSNSLQMPLIEKSPDRIEIKKPIREQILELAAAGFPSDVISEKLHISITEVQMVVDLFAN